MTVFFILNGEKHIIFTIRIIIYGPLKSGYLDFWLYKYFDDVLKDNHSCLLSFQEKIFGSNIFFLLFVLSRFSDKGQKRQNALLCFELLVRMFCRNFYTGIFFTVLQVHI
jgi:hypothetical protein